MIYETAFVVRPDASEEVVTSIKTALGDVFKEYGAEVLVSDSWGDERINLYVDPD